MTATQPEPEAPYVTIEFDGATPKQADRLFDILSEAAYIFAPKGVDITSYGRLSALPDVPEPQPAAQQCAFMEPHEAHDYLPWASESLRRCAGVAAPVVTKPKDPKCAHPGCGLRRSEHIYDEGEIHAFTPKSKGPRTRKASKLRLGDVIESMAGWTVGPMVVDGLKRDNGDGSLGGGSIRVSSNGVECWFRATARVPLWSGEGGTTP